MTKKTALVMIAVMALVASLVMVSGCMHRVAAYNVAKTDTDLQIVSINELMSTDGVLKTLDKGGLRPMTLEDFQKFLVAPAKIKDSFYVTGSRAGFNGENDCDMVLKYYSSGVIEFVVKCGQTKDIWQPGANFGAMPK